MMPTELRLGPVFPPTDPDPSEGYPHWFLRQSLLFGLLECLPLRVLLPPLHMPRRKEFLL